MSANVQPVEPKTVSPPVVRRLWVWIGAGLLLAASVGYVFGSHRSSDVTGLTGRAQVGDHVATIYVNDWAYGVLDSVPWLDSAGSFHEGGWPDCLGGVGGSPLVRFGAAPVTLPNDMTIRAVVFVDCRS